MVGKSCGAPVGKPKGRCWQAKGRFDSLYIHSIEASDLTQTHTPPNSAEAADERMDRQPDRVRDKVAEQHSLHGWPSGGERGGRGGEYERARHEHERSGEGIASHRTPSTVARQLAQRGRAAEPSREQRRRVETRPGRAASARRRASRSSRSSALGLGGGRSVLGRSAAAGSCSGARRHLREEA